MRLKGSIELFSYWNDLRKLRTAPERNDLDPVAMRNCLPETFLLEADRSGRLLFSLAGTQLDALFGITLKGQDFLSFWEETQRAEVTALINIVFDEIHPIVAGVSCGPQDYPKADFELLLLPLRHKGKTHSRLLGHLSIDPKPSWLGLAPSTSLKLGTMRVLDPSNSGQHQNFGSRPDGFKLNSTYMTFERRGPLGVYTVQP
jgi:hypothetical protein